MRNSCLISLIVGCLMLSGCSNVKNIQDLTYIVAIGMDYDPEKEEYTAYLQGLNFANVAKQEGSRPTEPIPIFIASAKGETLNLAVSKLYNRTEPPLFFGHVITLLLSQSIVTHRFSEVIEEVGRNRSLRPTLRVMCTDESIQEVFNIKALFNYPAIYTVLYKKGDTDLYQDELKPTTIMDFLREYNEPMGTAKLPSVKIDQESWSANKNYPVLYVDGLEIFQQQQYTNFLPFDEAILIDWLLEKKVSLTQRAEEGGQLAAVVKLATPKMKIKYGKDPDAPRFLLEVTAQADLLEKVRDIPLEKLKKVIEDDLKKRLIAVYSNGVKNKADLLNVGEKWYRTSPKEYEKLKRTKAFYLEEDSLKDVKVDVQILHFNSYKYD
ncbi:Ger(x)C family spore germination C-terminal domain-containing protein [Mesobacillus subterraneus]|uniref:Ger(x)C family spore germination C-terminal domain-containing protein n=1 Tax=Mesobacillus subterraneus TaxID=285983 RepID=UPI001CFCFEBB|nr:Ger(x)C family spore germination C-terminal domain-containing protein [Mesobacillus subterraneus]